MCVCVCVYLQLNISAGIFLVRWHSAFTISAVNVTVSPVAVRQPGSTTGPCGKPFAPRATCAGFSIPLPLWCCC